MSAPSSIAIVGGCGHVGLPLGLLFADHGHPVTLVDIDHERVAMVASGTMPFHERGASAVLERVVAQKRLAVTTDFASLGEHDMVVVTVGTPVDEFLDPDIQKFDRILCLVLERMRDGQLLMLRSTVFPGVTDRLGRAIEARGRRVELAYCPERIAQGFALEELRKLPQLVAGTTPGATARASTLFRSLGIVVLELAPVEAELAKLFSNSYRYINFAISNQFYMVAEKFGADFARIRAAVREEYPRMVGFAGAGFAAGPCLLKDTMQLAAFNHNTFALGQAAMMVNEGLPSFIVERLRSSRELSRDTIGILGMAFKGNCDDPRSSLAYKLRKILLLECRTVLCTDPYVLDDDLVPLERVLREADVLIVAACHEQYRDIVTDKPIVDVFDFVRRSRR